MRRLALRSVLSARAAEEAVTVVDAFTLADGKTKALLATLAALGAADGALIVLGERSDAVFRAARNLEQVHVVTPNGLCLLDILRLPRLIFVEAAIAELTKTLTTDLVPRSAFRVPREEPTPVDEAPTRARRPRKAVVEPEVGENAEPGTRNAEPEEDAE
jgi:hypothetical protein